MEGKGRGEEKRGMGMGIRMGIVMGFRQTGMGEPLPPLTRR